MSQETELSREEAEPSINRDLGSLLPSGIFQTQALMAFATAIARDRNVDPDTRKKAEEALCGDKHFLMDQIQLLTSALDSITHDAPSCVSRSHRAEMPVEDRYSTLQGEIKDMRRTLMQIEKDVHSTLLQILTRKDLGDLKWFFVLCLGAAAPIILTSIAFLLSK